MDLPAFAPTRSAEVLADAAMNLFRELDVPLDDVRGMGMIVSKLAPDSATSTATNMVPSTGIDLLLGLCGAKVSQQNGTR